MSSLDNYLDTAIFAAQKAAQIILDYLNSDKEFVSTTKGENDIVTNVDKESGRIIKEIISKTYPEHSIMLEESDLNATNNSQFLWVIDSIAGTIHAEGKLPDFGINITLVADDKPLIAVNHHPYTNDTFIAQKGNGSYHLNDKFNIKRPLQVNKISNTKEGIMLIDSGKSLEKRLWTAKIFSVLIPHFRQVDKFSDSREAGLLGESKVVGYVANEAFYWDFIGHKLIIEDAGGKTTDFLGNDLNIKSNNVVYSNGYIHQQIIELLKEAENN